MVEEKRKGQSWSIDVIIAVIIFILIITVFYSVISSKNKSDSTTDLKQESFAISSKLRSKSSATSIMENGEISLDKLEELCMMGYEKAKEELGVEDDFCIYFEDQNGDIIPIPCGATQKAGFGDPSINISSEYKCNDDI